MKESKLARSLVAVELDSVLEDAVTQSELLVLETLLVLIELFLLLFCDSLKRMKICLDSLSYMNTLVMILDFTWIF